MDKIDRRIIIDNFEENNKEAMRSRNDSLKYEVWKKELNYYLKIGEITKADFNGLINYYK